MELMISKTALHKPEEKILTEEEEIVTSKH